MNQMAIVNLLLGIVLLILGRKLFWLFVGVAGFLVGMEIAERFVTGPEGMKLLIAIAAGILGAVIAIFLQKVAIAIAGFVIGGYITVELLRAVRLVSKGVGRDTRYGSLRALHHRRHNRCSVVVHSFRLGADCAVILEWRVVDCPQYQFSESCASVAVCCFGCCRHPGPGADEAQVPCAGWRVKQHSKGMMGSTQFIFIIPKLLRPIFKCRPKELCRRWLIRSHWAEG